MFQSRLPKIAAELAVQAEVLARTGAELVAAKAKTRVPVATGKLRDAIHVEEAGRAEFMVVAGDTEAFYGHIIEHGGAHTPARPFLTPAAEEARGEIVALGVAALRRL